MNVRRPECDEQPCRPTFRNARLNQTTMLNGVAIGRTDEPRAYTTEVASRQSDRHPLLNGFPPAGARTAGPVTQDNGGVFGSDRDAPVCPPLIN